MFDDSVTRYVPGQLMVMVSPISDSALESVLTSVSGTRPFAEGVNEPFDVAISAAGWQQTFGLQGLHAGGTSGVLGTLGAAPGQQGLQNQGKQQQLLDDISSSSSSSSSCEFVGQQQGKYQGKQYFPLGMAGCSGVLGTLPGSLDEPEPVVGQQQQQQLGAAGALGCGALGVGQDTGQQTKQLPLGAAGVSGVLGTELPELLPLPATVPQGPL